MTKILERADKFYELTVFPQVRSLLFDMMRSSFKKPSSSSKAIHLGAQIQGVQFKKQQLHDYQAVCGFDESSTIPLTLPQVLAAPLHLFLFSQKAHPFPVFGMVHVGNTFEFFHTPELNKDYSLAVIIGETRVATKGCEFEVITELYDGDTLIWRGVMTILSRIKGMTQSDHAIEAFKPAPVDLNVARYLGLKIPARQGRDYAKVSGDFNPIHLHFLTARLFGFPKPLAHGMWTAAACLAKLERKLKKPAKSFEVSFRKPIFLPSHSVLKYETLPSSAQFELLSIVGSKVQASGKLA